LAAPAPAAAAPALAAAVLHLALGLQFPAQPITIRAPGTVSNSNSSHSPSRTKHIRGSPSIRIYTPSISWWSKRHTDEQTRQ
jgi:hypothetical protein